MTNRWTMAAAALLLTAAAATPAQTLRLRGTIESADGPGGLTVRLLDGSHSKLVLTDGASVIVVVRATLSDIRAGDFVGSAARPQADGTQRALEVHIFPEEMRGTGEGHRPYAPVPQATMTNGAIAGAPVAGVEGTTVTLRYRDGEQKITVPPDVPIVRFVRGNAADLKAGAPFTASAATARPDGSFETARISVGRNGAAPP